MGISFSCPLGDLDDLEGRFQAALLSSVSYKQGEDTTTIAVQSRFDGFNGFDSDHTIMKQSHSGKLVVEEPLGFEGMEVETRQVIETPKSDRENQVLVRSVSPMPADNDRKWVESNSYLEASSEPGNKRYQAALKLQKVYKSFRTRRRLADCAVLVEQRWWKLLDFAELKRSSISFFDIGKPETALSRWFRARKRAAKVGKGLSKDEKARKLALQHWLEAIDPRHRYGHNLQFYYVKWLHCQSREPFFYWLDIGEGKEVNLERCSRSKLQLQCIKYLGPTEREDYEVVIKDGKFFYKQSSKLIDTAEDKGAKWIFVLSVSKTLYVGKKNKGTFQHSSFLAGGATLSAGRLVVEDGVLKEVWPHSGHYLPTEENFLEFMSYLMEHNVDLTNVKKSPSEDDEQIIVRMNSRLPMEQSEAEALQESEAATSAESTSQESTDSRGQDSNGAANASPPISRLSRGLFTKISKLQIPTRDDIVDIFKPKTLPQNCHEDEPESPGVDGYETAEELLLEEEFMFPKPNLFGDDDDSEENKDNIPKEKIMKRIDSHNRQKTYQLAQQLCSRWSTGAGPRISCMRDYPSELQNQVLQHTHLSPRTRTEFRYPQTTLWYGCKVMTPTIMFTETGAARSPLAPPGAWLKPATP